jgi:hypothetical protein
MRKKPKHAYTGELPPLTVLKKIPNWRDALELEGVVGCDESTIQPHKNAKAIPPDAVFSSATITLANGDRLRALADVQARHAHGARVYTARGEACLAFSAPDRRWDVRGFVRAAFPKKSAEALFPALLELDLPWEEDSQRSIYWVMRDGSSRALTISTHKGFIRYEAEV